MMQADFFCALPADLARVLSRRTDPQTSKDAAAQAGALRDRHHAVIVRCLRTHGPLGKDGIAARTRLDGVAVCRRLGELQTLGVIRLTGKTVPSTAGRAEREWEAVE
jgi:predicted ArsR family transcriptional regulator